MRNKASSVSNQNKNELCDAYPAAYLQQGMLIENKKKLDKTIYHDVFAYSIYAAFNYEKFFKIWNKFITKHEALRLAFEFNEDYGYVCKIYKTIDLSKKF